MKLRKIHILFAGYTVAPIAIIAISFIACRPAGRAALFALAGLAVFILLTEIAAGPAYRILTGNPYIRRPKIPFDKIYFEPHPYLTYVLKRHFQTQREQDASYPLHKGKFKFGSYTTNNFRHLNGPGGDRDIAVPKPDGMVRVLCLGASTTGNYIRFEGRDYSYPMELERLLCEKFPGVNIEVNNCGAGGWTSTEILINFMLNLVDTEPDAVILYHAYNDLGPSLTPGFEPDYSHARRNLGETYNLYRTSSMMPDIPLRAYNVFLEMIFQGNIRHTIIQAVSRGNADLSGGFRHLPTYSRNIEHIINICKARGIDVVLSTYCNYLYPGIADDEKYKKYYEGVQLENAAVKNLAEKHGLPLVDNFAAIPREDKYFVDSVHFTPEGMNLLAQSFVEPVAGIIEKIKNRTG